MFVMMVVRPYFISKIPLDGCGICAVLILFYEKDEQTGNVPPFFCTGTCDVSVCFTSEPDSAVLVIPDLVKSFIIFQNMKVYGTSSFFALSYKLLSCPPPQKINSKKMTG
jgi:hypothetical protein